jgi:hypothetical protein
VQFQEFQKNVGDAHPPDVLSFPRRRRTQVLPSLQQQSRAILWRFTVTPVRRAMGARRIGALETLHIFLLEITRDYACTQIWRHGSQKSRDGVFVAE